MARDKVVKKSSFLRLSMGYVHYFTLITKLPFLLYTIICDVLFNLTTMAQIAFTLQWAIYLTQVGKYCKFHNFQDTLS